MTDEELQQIRARLHRLADTVQLHEVKIGEHGVLITVMNTHLTELRGQMSTREQLDSAVIAFGLKLDAAQEKMALKIDPLRNGIYGVIWLIIAAVILGGLAFLFRTPPKP